MYISKIVSSNLDSLEFDIFVTDGKYSVMCYAHGLYVEVGNEITEPLMCLTVHEGIHSEDPNYEIIKLDRYYSYSLTGKVVDKESQIIEVGNLKFKLDMYDIPNDVSNNDFLTIIVERIDFWGRSLNYASFIKLKTMEIHW